MQTKIKEKLFLNSTSLPAKKEVKLASTNEKTNHIFIFDRSGSMSWTLRELIEDLIVQAQSLPAGATFTAGWFSGTGQFGWICKGLSVSENKDAIPAMLRKYNDTVGMTCYSDILADTQKVLDDLSAIATNNTLVFFSDGFPNQSVNSIISLCKALAPKVSSALLVGYGNWYGRDFMAGMAQALGGVLVHSSNIQEFSKSFASFREGSENLQPRVEFKVPTGAKEFITIIDGNGDVVFYPTDEETILVSPDAKQILYFTENAGKDSEFSEEFLLPAIYATARSASQVGNYTLALDLLAKIGDVKFIDQLNNSFVIGEYGKLEADLLEAITDENMRFVSGQKENYVPADDQFCGLELIEALVDDPTAVLLPKHKDFSYRPVSRGTKQVDDKVKFISSDNVEVGLRSVVFSSEKLNISIGVDVPGIVKLDKEANKLGLDEDFKAAKFNNYTLILDGKWNIEKLPLKNLSEQTYNLVKAEGLIESEEDGVVVLNLKRIPVINRKIAGSYTDLDRICEFLSGEILLEAKQKAFSSLYKEFPEDVREQIESFVKATPYSAEQIEYLAKFGIDRQGKFAPKKEQLPVRDVLPYTYFEFAVKGAASLPSLNAVTKKVAEKKKLTPREQLLFDAVSLYEKETASMKTEKQKALYLKESGNSLRKELFGIRKELNRAKFAAVLGKKNFKQMPKLDNGTHDYTYNGQVFQVKIDRDAKEEI